MTTLFRSMLALIALAIAAFTVPAAAAADPPGQAQAIEQRRDVSAPNVSTVSAPITLRLEARLSNFNGGGSACIADLMDGKQTPAKPAPGKGGGGKKKCVFAAGPDDGDGSEGGDPDIHRRMLT